MAEALLEQRCRRLGLTLLASNVALVGEHMAETVSVADLECQQLPFLRMRERGIQIRLLRFGGGERAERGNAGMTASDVARRLGWHR